MKKILSVVTIMLAMVLCFTGCEENYENMQQYNYEKKIAEANSNAKSAYYAIMSYCEDEIINGTMSDYPSIVRNTDFTDDKYDEGSYYFSFDNGTPIDLSSYTGEYVNGYWYIKKTSDGNFIAFWFKDKSTYVLSINRIGESMTYSQQLAYAEVGDIIGAYPLSVDDPLIY